MFKLFFYITLSVFIISCGDSGVSDNLESNDLSKNVNQMFNFKKQKRTININLASGSLNREYVYNLKTENQINGESFYIYEGELPEGLELDESTGIISGTPQKSGDFKIKIAIKDQEDDKLVIIPANMSIDNNINFYKDVRSFIDISKSDNSGTVNHNGLINFSFSFYNTAITKLRVCQQGYLKLGGSNCALSSDLNNPSNTIFPFLDPELQINPNDPSSKIHYQIRGEEPRRMLIVQFKNLYRPLTDPKASQNFEVIIYEDTSRVTFLYGLSYPGIDTTQKHLGTNAAIGVFSTILKRKIIAPEDTTTPPKPQIFNGTVISFVYTSDQYKPILDSNVVTDFVDISRYIIETEDCTAASDCPTTNRCFQGKCSAQLLTNSLMYDGVEAVELPFYFNFYGNSSNEVNVHENGYLFFGAPNYNFYQTVPKIGDAKPVSDMDLDYVIAGLYSDIDLKSTRGGNILYNVIGSTPNRRAVFLYDKVRIRDENTTETHICTFEMVLHETSNVIEFLYGTNNKSDFCNGKVSSVGLKKDSSEYASIISNNQVLKQGKSIVFVPNDSTASSYTWVGVGNERNNSVVTSGVNGKFTVVGYQWTSMDDQVQVLDGYSQTIKDNQWIDTTTGTLIDLKNDGYNAISALNGKTFNFYGQPRSVFYIQANGGITVSNEGLYWNEPSDINYNALFNVYPDQGLFLYWNDLHIADATKIKTLQTQKNNQEVLVFEWRDIRRINNSAQIGWFTFQAQIYEDGQIYLCYDKMDYEGSNRDLTYITGIRNTKDDNSQYTDNLDGLTGLAATKNCISYTPTNVTAPNHIVGNRSTVSDEDGGEQNVPLGFSYDFQGTSYDNLTISSNGIAIFGNFTDHIATNNFPLSSTSVTVYDNSLALFWDDLNPNLSTDAESGVFYNTIGTAPNRIFLLSYNSIVLNKSTSSRINAQLVLKEGQSSILYCYGDLTGAFSTGDSATIGVRKTSSEYTQLLHKQAILEPNNCYLWTPPTSGFVEARNIYTGESNSDFIDLPVEHPDTITDGDYLDPLYVDEDGNFIKKPFKIYDLASQDYNFTFKGKEYEQLFVDANGAVSFGNDNDAAIITGPLWGDVFYQEDIVNKSHVSLQSQYENVENNFMWIANSGSNDLSKVNTYSGTVTGPFPVGLSPSRTAVGFDGSVWVGNRNSHSVTKLDRDGVHICTVTLASGCSPRGIALDKDENVWVGCGNWMKTNDAKDGWIYKIKDNHNQTGDRCEFFDIRKNGDTANDLSYKAHYPYGHYGFAIDKKGILWSSTGTHDKTHNYFARIDTNKTHNESGFYKKFRGHSNNPKKVGNTWVSREGAVNNNDGTPFQFYGIAIDLEGDLWLGNYGHSSKTIGVTRAHYDSGNDTLNFQVFPPYNGQKVTDARGVAIDINGDIYVAYSTTNNIGKYDSDGTALALFELNSNGPNDCTTPAGIGVDGDGQIWANCMNGYSEEINPITGVELTSLKTGDSPYCYSDNTGFNLRNIVTDVKPAKYYAKVVEKIEKDSVGNKICARVLVIQWRDVRIKTNENYGYTESTFEMIFDNGYRYGIESDNGRDVCDNTAVATPNVTIKYLYGALQGNRYSQKTGGQSMITIKAINSSYNHMFGDNDSGSVNSGSKLIITSEK